MSKSDNLSNHKKLDHKYKITNNTFSKIMKKIGSTAALVALLNFASPTDIKAQNSTDVSKEKTEVVVGLDMLNSIQHKTGVNLPNEYKQKAKDFLDYSKIFKDKDAREFTENFITKQMKKDRGINKENQQLFVLYSIFEYTVNEDIYDGEDGDETRLKEFENAVELIDNCGKLYVEELTQYMKNLSAEARQQSAEARQQSAEARQQSAEARQQSAEAKKKTAYYEQQSAEAKKKTAYYEQQSAEARQQSAEARQQSAEATVSGLNELLKFYNLYKKNPNNVKESEIKQAKEHSKWIIENCREYGIDYKAKLSPEMLKFYGVE